MDRAFGQAGTAAASWLGGLALGKAVGLRFLKAHKGRAAKNGDDNAMTRLLGGEVPTEEVLVCSFEICSPKPILRTRFASTRECGLIEIEKDRYDETGPGSCDTIA